MRILLRAIGEGKATAPDQILSRWTWKLARATRKVQDRRASAEFPEAKRLLGAVANSRGHRHEENVAKLVQAARALPLAAGAALLASADGYTPACELPARPGPRGARRDPGDREALAENLPAPKAPVRKSRRRRKKRRPAGTRAVATGRGRPPSRRRAGIVRRQPGEGASTPIAAAAPVRARRRPHRERRLARSDRGATAPAAGRPSRGRAGSASARPRAIRPSGVRTPRSVRRSCPPAARAPRRRQRSPDRRRPPR